MSVLQISVHVTRTRTAPTVTVLIAALANKVLMEMVQLVKVYTCRTASENTMLELKVIPQNFIEHPYCARFSRP